jgi:hypothetical protein
MDPFGGNDSDPPSLHRYLYVAANPVNGVDPTGKFGSLEFGMSVSIRGILAAAATLVFASSMGAVIGAGDAYLRGDDVVQTAANGGLIGLVTGPFVAVHYIRPAIVAFGTLAGVVGVADAIDQGNASLIGYRAALTLFGSSFFKRSDSPVFLPTNPNTGGAVVRVQLLGIALELQTRGWKINWGGGMFPEEWVANSVGPRRGAFVDLTATKSGRTLRVQTIDTLADGVTPTLRESANAALIRANTPPSDHLILVPKLPK